MSLETINYLGIHLIRKNLHKRNIVESYHVPVYYIQIKLCATHAFFFFLKDMYISCNGDPKYRSSPVLGVQPKKQQSVSILEEKPTILNLL